MILFEQSWVNVHNNFGHGKDVRETIIPLNRCFSLVVVTKMMARTQEQAQAATALMQSRGVSARGFAAAAPEHLHSEWSVRCGGRPASRAFRI